MLSPEEVVKVISDPRFHSLVKGYTGKYHTFVNRPTQYGLLESDPSVSALATLAWAKRMFDQWDKEV